MSATAIKSLRVHLKFGPSVITPDQRSEAFGVLRGLLHSMSGSSITLCDQNTWTFRVEVPEGTPFGTLLFGGVFEITKAPITAIPKVRVVNTLPSLPWEPRRNFRPVAM